MNTIWSSYIQTTDELNESRDLRFTDKNKSLWLEAIGAQPGMKILEVGCGGGIFCLKLKRFVPDIDITGIDLDSGHISRAKVLGSREGCNFLVQNAAALQFPDETFDLCYSHTVAEHIPHDKFFGEQYRVLKPGGRISVLSVRTRLNIKLPDSRTDEEKALLEKAWQKAGAVEVGDSEVGAYELCEQDYPRELEKYGFKQYEISNFAQPGFESKHNLKYWRCEEYYGIGPSAHSYINGVRKACPKSVSDFIASEIQQEYVTEECGGDDEERTMLSLRLTNDGLNLELLAEEQRNEVVKRSKPLIAAGYIVKRGERLTLTPKGCLVSNEIICQLTL